MDSSSFWRHIINKFLSLCTSSPYNLELCQISHSSVRPVSLKSGTNLFLHVLIYRFTKNTATFTITLIITDLQLTNVL
jgi:hypothetical protein